MNVYTHRSNYSLYKMNTEEYEIKGEWPTNLVSTKHAYIFMWI